MAAEAGVIADELGNFENVGDNSRLPFPLKTTTGAVVINDNRTDIVITEFENKFLIVATQYEKLGTLMVASKEVGQGDDAIPVYNVSTILGKDDPEIHVFGRMLAEKLNAAKPIVLGLALKELTPSTAKTVVEEILTLISKR